MLLKEKVARWTWGLLGDCCNSWNKGYIFWWISGWVLTALLALIGSVGKKKNGNHITDSFLQIGHNSYASKLILITVANFTGIFG